MSEPQEKKAPEPPPAATVPAVKDAAASAPDSGNSDAALEQTLFLPPDAAKIPMPADNLIDAFEAGAAKPAVAPAPAAPAELSADATLMLPPEPPKIAMPGDATITLQEQELARQAAASAPSVAAAADATLMLPADPPKIAMPGDGTIMAMERELAQAAAAPAPVSATVQALMPEDRPVAPVSALATEPATAPVAAQPKLNDGAAESVAQTAAVTEPPRNGGNGSHAAKAAAPEIVSTRPKLAATGPASRSAFLPPVDSPFAPVPETVPLPPETSIIGLPSASSYQLRRVMAAPPKPPPDPLLQAQGLKKSFGKREVVRGVDLNVGPGEIVGLLGRNGAGKTTTFRMIMGMLQPDAGSVRFDHREITRLAMYARANRGLGYLAQEPSVFQKLTVEENLQAVLELQVPERKKREAKLDELIRMLGLETVRKSRAATLSGGERRRLEIARAMTLNPKIVLFDEPFAGIDPIAVNEIQNILRDLKRAGVGVLLTDHNVRETLNITDRTYIMDEGVIWIHGSPREIVNHPEARKRYLGHEFRLDF